jgi:hypothetical protein
LFVAHFISTSERQLFYREVADLLNHQRL